MWSEQLPQPFIRAEALAAGVSARRVSLAVRRAELTVVARGVYATSAPWARQAPWERHRALAVAARRTTPDAIVSHTSAAALLDLPLPPSLSLRASLTLLDDSRTSPSDSWRDFHRGATPPGQVVIRRRVPELVPARTVVDAARVVDRRDGLALVDAALRRGLVTRRDLVAMRSLQRHWRGVGRVDVLLDLADPLRESWLESASAWVMHDWSLPAPRPQVVVLDARGRFVARVDALWLDHGVVGEADGVGKYLAGASDDDAARRVARATVAQLQREDRIRDLGLGVVRWATQDLDAPLVLRTRILDALHRGDPGRITATFRCSCCQRDLSDWELPTRRAPFRVGNSQSVA